MKRLRRFNESWYDDAMAEDPRSKGQHTGDNRPARIPDNRTRLRTGETTSRKAVDEGELPILQVGDVHQVTDNRSQQRRVRQVRVRHRKGKGQRNPGGRQAHRQVRRQNHTDEPYNIISYT